MITSKDGKDSDVLQTAVQWFNNLIESLDCHYNAIFKLSSIEPTSLLCSALATKQWQLSVTSNKTEDAHVLVLESLHPACMHSRLNLRYYTASSMKQPTGRPDHHQKCFCY